MVNPTSLQDPLENLCASLATSSDRIGEVACKALKEWKENNSSKPLSKYNIAPLETKLQAKAASGFFYYIAYVLEYLFGLSLGVKEADALLLIKKAKEEERLNTLQNLLQTTYPTGFLNCRASKETVPKEGTFSIDPLDLMMGGDGVYLANSILDKLDEFSENTDKTFCAALLNCVEACVKKGFPDMEQETKNTLQEKIIKLRCNLIYLREQEFKSSWNEIKTAIPKQPDQNREEVLRSYVEFSLEQVEGDMARSFEITTPKGVLSCQSIKKKYDSLDKNHWIQELKNLQSSLELQTKTLNRAIERAIGEFEKDSPNWDDVRKPVACVLIMESIEGIGSEISIDKWEKMARILSPLHQGIFATVDTSLSSYGLALGNSGDIKINIDSNGQVTTKVPKRIITSNYRRACLSGDLDDSIKDHASTEEKNFWSNIQDKDLKVGGRAVIGLFDEEISLNVFEEGLNFQFTPSMERPWKL